VLVSIAITVAGLTILGFRGLPTPPAGDLLDLYARNALVAGLLGAFGVGIGVLVRNQAIAIVGLLIYGFAIEPVLAGLVPEVARFGPVSGLPTAITNVNSENAGLGNVALLSPGLAVLAMLAWVGSFFAVGGALLRRRDLE
jgi:ABC-2 type transport system permease protein